jgi:hypothetical protein
MEGVHSLCSLLRWKKIAIPQFKGHKKNGLVTCGLFAIIVLTSVVFTVQRIEAKKAPEVGMAFAAPAGMFIVGEELVYEVSYSIFALGTVKLQILDTIAKDGVTLYQAKAFIDSYSGVPFVNLHYVFYSEIDRACYSHFFSGLDAKDPLSTSFSEYVFDYSNKRVSYEKGIRQQPAGLIKGADTISVVYQDGLSLFYYARANIRSSKAEIVPTFVNEQKVATYINFKDTKTSCEIDAVEYPVGTIEFDGRAEFVGIFGLTGGFSGWFSNDEAAIPIVAKMKVILGSVRIELKRWNRPGWVPPRAVGQ